MTTESKNQGRKGKSFNDEDSDDEVIKKKSKSKLSDEKLTFKESKKKTEENSSDEEVEIKKKSKSESIDKKKKKIKFKIVGDDEPESKKEKKYKTKKVEVKADPLNKDEIIISGIVDKINYPRARDSPCTLEVTEVTAGKKCILIHPLGFCVIEKNDSIVATCKEIAKDKYAVGIKTYKMTKPPMTQVPVDKQSVTECFIRALRGQGIGAAKAKHIYDIILKNCNRDPALVISKLSDMAARWSEYRDQSVIKEFSSVLEEKQAQLLLIFWHKKHSQRQLWLLGLNNMEIKSCNMSMDDIYQQCVKNPYVLHSLSMDKCEEILARQNKKNMIKADKDIYRCGLVTRAIYKELKDNKHIACPYHRLLYDNPAMEDLLPRLKAEYKIKVELDHVYLRYPYNVENTIAETIIKLMSKEVEQVDPVFKEDDIKYSDDQKDAVTGGLNQSLSMIMGGAGTGKTRIIGQIYKNLQMAQKEPLVVSFTGKAAANVTDKNNIPASTIHRAINRLKGLRDKAIDKEEAKNNKTLKSLKKATSKTSAKAVEDCAEALTNTESKNASDSEKRKIHTVIIDEAPQVSMPLFFMLLMALKEWQGDDLPNFILVGDENQLTPIDWGQLVMELLKSKTIPVFKLIEDHRYKFIEVNGIILNSKAIIKCTNGKPVKMREYDNFIIIDEPSEKVCTDELKKTLEKMRDSTDYYTKEDILILSPVKHNLSTFNRLFQKVFYNTDSKKHKNKLTAKMITDHQGIQWIVGDRVIMTKNNYGIGVMNGDEGIVTDVIGNECVRVNFGKKGEHKFILEPENKPESKLDDELDEIKPHELDTGFLIHSYALTTYKSQGSERKLVIFIYPETNGGTSSFYTRNLMYTSITRATDLFIFIGSRELFEAAAGRPERVRHSCLSTRLLKELKPIKSESKEEKKEEEEDAEDQDYIDEKEDEEDDGEERVKTFTNVSKSLGVKSIIRDDDDYYYDDPTMDEEY